jgi:ribonuclease Z
MFDITFLGTAASTPSAERGLPAVLVGAPSARFLPGRLRRRHPASAITRAGSGLRRLGHVLLTHAHLDHVLGLGGLIATLGLFDVRQGLSIYGSGETLRFVEQYLASLYPLPRAPVPLQFIELQPGPVLSSREFSVTCFPVRHRGTASLGYRFDATPRRHLRADRLAALGVPSGPLRARLAAGEAVVLPDGRTIEPEAVLGPPAVGVSLAVVGDAGEVEALVGPVSGADALVIGDFSRSGCRARRRARPSDGGAGRPSRRRRESRHALSDAHLRAL